jgi:archaemetzincin
MRPPDPRAERAAAAVDEVQLVPLGDCPRPLVEALAARLSRQVGVACRVPVDAVPSRDLPALAGREQLDAHALLLRLASSPRGSPAGVVRLGLTTRDIGLPVFSFVFGLARTDDGRVAVVSLARLDPVFYGLPPDPEAAGRRALGEMLHELGHVAGLQHCLAPDCVMRFAGTVEKADARGCAFCDACRGRLPQWLRPRRGLGGV